MTAAALDVRDGSSAMAHFALAACVYRSLVEGTATSQHESPPPLPPLQALSSSPGAVRLGHASVPSGVHGILDCRASCPHLVGCLLPC